MQPVVSRDWIERWMGLHPGDAILRWLFRALVAATVGVLIVDYSDLERAIADRATLSTPIEQPSSMPLPSTSRGGNRRQAGPLRTINAKLREPMTFELAADGRLLASGTITPNTAEVFAAEISKRGSYVKDRRPAITRRFGP